MRRGELNADIARGSCVCVVSRCSSYRRELIVSGHPFVGGAREERDRDRGGLLGIICVDSKR